jgi:ABC-type uncharacterized transport system permease subunit
MKKLFLLLTSIVFSYFANAQSELFKVLITKGNNQYVSASGTSNLLVGKKITAADKITVAEGGYVGLVYQNGKTIEIKKAGTYEASKLVAQVSAQNASASTKYVNYVSGQMASTATKPNYNRDVTGSVERANDNSIKIIAPFKSSVLEDAIILEWAQATVNNKPATTYIVKIYNEFDENIYTNEIINTKAIVDLKKLNISSEKRLFWTVEVKDYPKYISAKHELMYLEGANSAEITTTYNEMKATLTEESAINKYMLANYCAENNLVLNAMKLYEDAISLEPEVTEYQTAYNDYLTELKLK